MKTQPSLNEPPFRVDTRGGRYLDLSADTMPDMDPAKRLDLTKKYARSLLTSHGRYQTLPGIAFDCERLEIVEE